MPSATHGKTLDYGGTNLVAGFQYLANPKGIVLDRAFCVNLLSRELPDIFAPSQAFVRGIAETRPGDIYIQKGYVQISEHAMQPFAAHGDPGRAASAPPA